MRNKPVKTITDSEAAEKVDRIPLQTAQQIKARLAQLEKSERYEVVQSAMCYRVAPPASRVDYLCPKCGARVVFTDNMVGYIQGIESARSTLLELNKLAVKLKSELQFTLDESPLCARCSKGKSGMRAALVVTDKRKHVHRADLEYPSDLYAIQCLLKGKRYAGLVILGDISERLTKLMGLEHG